MHLGGALGLPTVAIFSGYDRAGAWTPFAGPLRELREPVPCAPCLAERCLSSGECLTRIGVDAVWRALGELVDLGALPARPSAPCRMRDEPTSPLPADPQGSREPSR
jgi:hypothetical protein